jgi:hypothetical protein
VNRIVVVGLVVTGLLAFMLFLFHQAPAGLLADALPPDSPLEMDGFHGRLWDGSARLRTRRAEIGTIRWTVSGFQLLRGVMDVRMVVEGPNVDLRARIRHGYLTDRTELTGLDADIALAALAEMTGIERLFDANVSARGLDLVMDDAVMQSVGGDVRLDAVTLLHPRRQLMGSYGISLQADNEWIRARVTDAQGPLDIDGEVGFTATGLWRVDLRLQARSEDADLTRGLTFVGPQDADGRYLLQLSGEL